MIQLATVAVILILYVVAVAFLFQSSLLSLTNHVLGNTLLVFLVLFFGTLAVYILMTQQIALLTTYLYTENSIRRNIRDHRKYIFPYAYILLLTFVVVVLGLVLFVVPGIFFLTWFFAAPLLMITTDARGASALQMSKRMVSKRFFVTALRLVSVIVLSMVVSIGLSYVNKYVNIFATIFVLIPFNVAYVVVMYRQMSK